ncbi:MAG TPA: hypothetical protein VIT23_15160 [Terrimicrobiaceae bacterium]
MSEAETPQITLQELPELRRKTEAISQLLRQQIASHLDTLGPILRPDRIFGEHIGRKTELTVADRALSELQQLYRPFTGKPYELPSDLGPNWLSGIGKALDLHPWEYVHDIQGKAITISSPVRWIVTFRSSYTVAQVKSVIAGKEATHPENLRQFVVNALALQVVLARTPGLVPLFGDLRYDLNAEIPAELKGLPLATITSCLTSFRPADELIIASTAFSGIPAFVELVDLDAVKKPRDILKEKLEDILRQ